LLCRERSPDALEGARVVAFKGIEVNGAVDIIVCANRQGFFEVVEGEHAFALVSIQFHKRASHVFYTSLPYPFKLSEYERAEL
jgi:hypothetical protein